MIRIVIFFLVGFLMANQAAASNQTVEINLPPPFNLQFILDMRFPLDRFDIEKAKNPWKPICITEQSSDLTVKQTQICQIYVGDRAKGLLNTNPDTFPAFVNVKLLDPKIIKDKQHQDDFIKSLDPDFFTMKNVNLSTTLKEMTNANQVPLIIVNCSLEGDYKEFSNYIIVKSSPPILISSRGEVRLDSIRFSTKGSDIMNDCTTNTIYQRAKSLLDQATTALSVSNYKESNALLDEAIAIIGNSYSDSNILDDIGMKLVLAQSEEKKGNLSIAANLKKNVIASRLAMYCYKINPSSQNETH